MAVHLQCGSSVWQCGDIMMAAWWQYGISVVAVLWQCGGRVVAVW